MSVAKWRTCRLAANEQGEEAKDGDTVLKRLAGEGAEPPAPQNKKSMPVAKP